MTAEEIIKLGYEQCLIKRGSAVKLMNIAKYGELTCEICKRTYKKGTGGFDIDHWIPKSKGGTNDLSNLKAVHKKCNNKKSDALPEEL